MLIFMLGEPLFWANPTHYGIQVSTRCWISLLGFFLQAFEFVALTYMGVVYCDVFGSGNEAVLSL